MKNYCENCYYSEECEIMEYGGCKMGFQIQTEKGFKPNNKNNRIPKIRNIRLLVIADGLPITITCQKNLKDELTWYQILYENDTLIIIDENTITQWMEIPGYEIL